MVTYSERIRSLRKKAAINQDDLARIVGVSRFSVSGWELGKQQPNADELTAMADYFRVSVDYLLGRTDWESDFAKSISLREVRLIEMFIDYIRSLKSAK